MTTSRMPDDPLERFWYEAATDLHAAADRLPPECTLSLGEAGELLLEGEPMSHWRARGAPFKLSIFGVDYEVFGKEDHYDSHSDACAGVRLSGTLVPTKRSVGRLSWRLEYMHMYGDGEYELAITNSNGEEVDLDNEDEIKDDFYNNMICLYQFPYHE